MKTSFIFTGKTVNPHLLHLIEDYLKRITFYLPVSIITIPDLKTGKSLSVDEQKEREGTAILQSLPNGTFLVLLDEHGRMYRSVEFAAYLNRKQMSVHNITFVIGGPYGFSPDLIRRADDKLSLSPMTFSHQMVRLLFVEQFYRALTIQHNHPYHHE